MALFLYLANNANKMDIMQNKHIEDLIGNPYNTSVIGYNTSRTNPNKTYFIDVKGRYTGAERFFIYSEEVEYFENIIAQSNKAKEDKKQALKIANKLKSEEKLRKLDEGKIALIVESEENLDDIEEDED